MKIGTSHFLSEEAAVTYYRAQGLSRADVRRKAKAGEIHYGPPPLKEGEALELIDCFTRYAILKAKVSP